MFSLGQKEHLCVIGESRPATSTTPSASPIFRHVGSKDGLPDLGASTLYELFEKAVQQFSTNDCLGARARNPDGTAGDYVFLSYKQVHKEVCDVASGLRAIGVSPGERVGVFGVNCPEWMQAMQACNRLNLQCVPLYDSLGENAIDFIIHNAAVTCTFASAAKIAQLSKALDHQHVKGVLRHVVLWGHVEPASLQELRAKGFKVHLWHELKAAGAARPAAAVPPRPEDVATIMYTSGTTGDPKGVVLSHRAVIASVGNAEHYCARNNVDFQAPDRILSYLPLAHIFDRVVEEWALKKGCAIGYWQGDIGKLVDDIAALKPAIFIGVPRVFDRIHARITSQIQGSGIVARTLFSWAYNRKKYYMAQGWKQDQASPLSDRLIFSKLKARLGGNVRAIVSGGAPLSPHVEEFLRVTMCAPAVQGYGLTETGATSFIAAADVFEHLGSVGPPTPLTELKLESVPELSYDALNPVEPKGEILIRGPAVFSGYHGLPDKTAEVLDKEGWFHTGDIGVVSESGAINIIDRKKNIFKLGQGEYIAVEKVESAYMKAPLVEQVWVYGDSFKNHLVAVAVPNDDYLKPWCDHNGIRGSLAERCRQPKVVEHVLKALQDMGKAEKLRGFELLKAVHLEPVAFSQEDDLVTPTFKFKRNQLKKKYTPQIDAMYASIEK